jgi:hypothetical protein
MKTVHERNSRLQTNRLTNMLIAFVVTSALQPQHALQKIYCVCIIPVIIEERNLKVLTDAKLERKQLTRGGYSV